MNHPFRRQRAAMDLRSHCSRRCCVMAVSTAIFVAAAQAAMLVR